MTRFRSIILFLRDTRDPPEQCAWPHTLEHCVQRQYRVSRVSFLSIHFSVSSSRYIRFGKRRRVFWKATETATRVVRPNTRHSTRSVSKFNTESQILSFWEREHEATGSETERFILAVCSFRKNPVSRPSRRAHRWWGVRPRFTERDTKEGKNVAYYDPPGQCAFGRTILIVCRRGQTGLSNVSIPSPGGLSEFERRLWARFRGRLKNVFRVLKKKGAPRRRGVLSKATFYFDAGENHVSVVVVVRIVSELAGGRPHRQLVRRRTQRAHRSLRRAHRTVADEQTRIYISRRRT